MRGKSCCLSMLPTSLLTLSVVQLLLLLLILLSLRLLPPSFSTKGDKEEMAALPPRPEQVVPPAEPNEIAVVVLAARRPEVQQLLGQLLATRPAKGFRLLVAQDGAEPETERALRRFPDREVARLQFHRDNGYAENHEKSYARISQHVRRVLDCVLLKLGFRYVVVLEDDLLIAPDFFRYFAALRKVLDTDPSVFCVSAWNDNGLAGLVADDPTLLHRTDFFPGLGWMLARPTWLRIRRSWPATKFDDFLRRYMLSQSLVCVRPELSRTFNIGRWGGSQNGGYYTNTFYQKYLSKIVLNQHNVSLPDAAIRRVIGRSAEAQLEKRVRDMPEMRLSSMLGPGETGQLPAEARVNYATAHEFMELALRLGIIPEVWFGAPRASLLGIVVLSVRSCRLYLVPDARLPLDDVIVTAYDVEQRRWQTMVAIGCLVAAACLIMLARMLTLVWTRLSSQPTTNI